MKHFKLTGLWLLALLFTLLPQAQVMAQESGGSDNATYFTFTSAAVNNVDMQYDESTGI